MRARRPFIACPAILKGLAARPAFLAAGLPSQPTPTPPSNVAVDRQPRGRPCSSMKSLRTPGKVSYRETPTVAGERSCSWVPQGLSQFPFGMGRAGPSAQHGVSKAIFSSAREFAVLFYFFFVFDQIRGCSDLGYASPISRCNNRDPGPLQKRLYVKPRCLP